MNKRRKTRLLVAELVAGLVYAGLMTLRVTLFPESVRAMNPPVVYALGCTLYLALIVGVFNISYIAEVRGHPLVSLIAMAIGVLMAPYLLLVSFARF
jgi:hypothetical protein